MISDYSTIDGLRIVLSQGISKVSDVRNPRDVVELMEVLTGIDVSGMFSDEPYELLVDAMYRRGICI